MRKTNKGIQLLNKYAFTIYNSTFSELADNSKKTVRICALNCVDEILNDNPNIYDSDRLNQGYWNAVKEVIILIK